MRDMSNTAVEQKRQREMALVSEMIKLYCHKNHGMKEEELCPECNELLNYAQERSRRCPFMKTKTFCSNCKVHCYKPQMRERIRAVMRFSGPRMLWHHPLMVTWHVVSYHREKKRLSLK